MDQDIAATFHLDLRALKLEFKTTCDALKNWPGGPVEEQQFLEHKKQELFRALVEQTYQSQLTWNRNLFWSTGFEGAAVSQPTLDILLLENEVLRTLWP